MTRKKGKHLTFDDRCEIEEMLAEGESFRAIAKRIGASPTTVSNEVRLNKEIVRCRQLPVKAHARCSRYSECEETSLCYECTSSAAACKRCGKKRCWDRCPNFTRSSCPKLAHAPFVCVCCHKRRYCTYDKARYKARSAQEVHDARLSLAHSGIACDEHKLAEMVAKVKKLLLQGHSLEAIWAVHGESFPVCVRTFYNYMDKGVMGLANIDLPRKVRYAPRKKREEGAPKMAMEGRTYSDWLELPEEDRLLTVQMDTVEGARRSTKCILSLHFPTLFFQLYILLPAKTQDCVKAALDAIELYCEGAFTECFPAILTDRGSEFLDPAKIETGLDGTKRTRVFYCDPIRPGQKGACEKNHVELRKVIPKGTDLDRLEQQDVAMACSHVNSYVRAGRRVAPITLARAALPANLLDSLGIEVVLPDDVIMKPGLIGL